MQIQKCALQAHSPFVHMTCRSNFFSSHFLFWFIPVQLFKACHMKYQSDLFFYLLNHLGKIYKKDFQVVCIYVFVVDYHI